MQRLTKQTFRIFWQHAKAYPWSVFIMTAAMLLSLVGQLYTPFLYKNFFNILSGYNFSLYHSLVHLLILILATNLFIWAIQRVNTLKINTFENSVMRDLMNTCFDYLQRHSYKFFSDNFSGSLQRKVTRYARAFEAMTDLLVSDALPNILRVVAVVVILFYTYWKVGVIVLVWSILHTTFNYYFTQYRLKYDLQKSQADTAMSGFLADTITNNINLKVFNALELEKNGFRQLANKWYQISKKSWDLDALSYGLQGLLMVFIEFLIFFVSLHYWRQGIFHVGDFIFIQSYVLLTFNNVYNFSRYLKSFYGNLAEANEMTEILLTPLEIVDIPDAPKLAVTSGAIDFAHVAYAYNDKNAIYTDFNLSIHGGEKLAIIGPSGGGKSTFIKLLLRFYDLNGGAILIDGQDIAKVTQDSLRQNIGYVPQEPILFHRSVMENIRYSKPEATDMEVQEAARLAHCHEFISGFPEGYNTMVGERGIKLSGGERQRVAIARAILKDAPILLLDEATSSLDSESEKFIQEALHTLMQNKTTIVIAHRLSTVMQMDRIVVIDNGAVAEQGKHEELLKLQEGIYQKLWGIQAGGFTGESEEEPDLYTQP